MYDARNAWGRGRESRLISGMLAEGFPIEWAVTQEMRRREEVKDVWGMRGDQEGLEYLGDMGIEEVMGIEEDVGTQRDTRGQAQGPGGVWDQVKVVNRSPWYQTSTKARTEEEEEAVKEWLSKEQEKGNIKEVRKEELIGISPIFPIRKSSGGWRVIHDLRTLNKRCTTRHFKMEGVETVRKFWRHHKWAVTLDLRDAFRHLRLEMGDRALFGFTFQGKYYQQVAMPFGWSLAPYYWNIVSMH